MCVVGIEMNQAIHDYYDNADFIIISNNMGVKKNTKTGKWEKDPKYFFRKEWEHTPKHDYNKRVNTFAMLTGKANGITAIDIDDVSLEHNQKLMEMMDDCTMVAKTKKGFHYVFKYCPLIKGVAVNELALDTRNDNNCIFCEPTLVKASDDSIVATYKWIKKVDSKEDLVEIPTEVLAYLKSLSLKYFLEYDEPKKSKSKSQKVEEDDDGEQDEMEDTSSTNTASSNPSNDKEKDILHKLADCITNNNNYSDWLNNGIICFNEGLELDVWEQMSKKCKGYEEGACAEKWKTFASARERKLTQATWWKWLKTNNPAKYQELIGERNDLLEKIKLINHNDIAKLFWNIHPTAYAYNTATGWFVLNKKSIWEVCDEKQPEKLKNHIADTFQELLTEALEAVLNKYAKICKGLIGKQDELEKKEKEKKEIVKLINKAYMMCGSSDFCNGVIQFLREKYNIDNLEDIMGTNPYLFAFKNGMCFDLKELQERPIVPTDYICLTAGYAMPTKSNSATREAISNFIYGLFEDKEVQDYLLKVLSTCLFGGNRFEEFYVFTGSGGNGKGVISELLHSVFGDYYYSVSVNLFTKPVDKTDQPIPALVDARNKRIMMTAESEADDELRQMLLKKMVGGDIIEARTLHSKHIYRYKATYKPIFQMNAIPKLKNLDEAMKRRMRIINFPFQFRPVCVGEKDRLADPDVKEKYCKSEEWRNEFVLMLWETYQQIADAKSLPTPNAVKEATNDYFDDNNPIKFWLEAYFVKTDGSTDKVQSSDLFRMFLEDTKAEKYNKQHFAQSMIFNGFQKKKVHGREFYCGLRRKTDEELGNQIE